MPVPACAGTRSSRHSENQELGPRLRGRAAIELARALDCDKTVAAPRAGVLAAGRHRTGDVVAFDLAERLHLREGLRLAIRACDHPAARFAAGEAAVDAV